MLVILYNGRCATCGGPIWQIYNRMSCRRSCKYRHTSLFRGLICCFQYFTMSFNGFIKCIHKGRLTNWFFHEGSQTYILGVGGFLKRRLKHLCFIGFSKFVLQSRMGCFDETLNCFTLLLKLNANDMQQSNRKLNIAPSEQIIFFIWPARI